MFILHCSKCHHEWQGFDKNEKCDWCGAKSYILGEDKSWNWKNIYKCLEKMIKRDKNEK